MRRRPDSRPELLPALAIVKNPEVAQGPASCGDGHHDVFGIGEGASADFRTDVCFFGKLTAVPMKFAANGRTHG